MRVPGFGNLAAPTAPWPSVRGAAGSFGLRRALIGLVVLGGSSVLGYQLYQRTLGAEVAPPVPAQTVVATRRSIVERVSLPGSVAAARQSKLSFAASGSGVSVSGTVRSISVRTGDAVKQGQELARLDTTALDLSVQSAQASLTIARSKFATLLDGALPPDVASAEQSVIAARASLARVESELATLRGGGLDAGRAGGTQALLNAQNGLVTMQQALDAIQARANLNVQAGTVRQTLDAMNAQSTRASAELEAAVAALAASNLTASHTGPMVLSAVNDALAMVRERCVLLTNRDRCMDIAAPATDGPSLLAAIAASTDGPRSMGGVIESFNGVVPAAGAAVQSAALRSLQATAVTPGLNARVYALVVSVGSGGGIPSADALASATRSRDAAQASLNAARAKFDALLAGEPADVQNAINAVESARASLTTAVARRDQVLVGALPTDILQSGQSVVQAELSLSTAQNNRDGAVLVAPYDGLIGAVTMTVGEPSGAGSIILVDPLSMQLNASVQEADVVRLRPGQAVALSFDALAGTTLQGRLASISPTADVVQGVASYAVVVEIPPRPGAASRLDLRTGMAGTAGVEISRRDNALTVPVRALRRSGRDQTVEVSASGKSEIRVVTIGATDGTNTEITGGLQEGDVIVIPTATATTTTRALTTGTQQPGAGGGPPGGFPAGPPAGGPGR